MQTPEVPTYKIVLEFITALAPYIWPIAVTVILGIYREPVGKLLGRIKELKLFGTESTLEPEITKIQGELEEAAEEQDIVATYVEKALPVIDEPTKEIPKLASADVKEKGEKIIATSPIQRPEHSVDKILELASKSPEIALIKLANLIEWESIKILGMLGHLKGQSVNRPRGLSSVFRDLFEKKLIPLSVRRSGDSFARLRNQIVHSKEIVDEKEALRLLDVGVRLLDFINSIPREEHIVHSTVELYLDEGCTQPAENIEGVLITSFTPDGGILLRAFNTTRVGYYVADRNVTWEWDMASRFPETFYRNERSGKVHAINSLAFIGEQFE